MTSPKLWFLATRPWSFTMSALSVTVASLWGASSFSVPFYIATLSALVALHGGTNLLNDYFDVKNGVDTSDVPTIRYRPHPLMNRELRLSQVLGLAIALYFLGCGAGLWLAAARGWPVLAIGLFGVFVSVAYTAPPFVLKHRAFGELAVILMWGPLVMLGANYVQTRHLSWSLALVSVPFGLLVGLVILANNLRDAESDRSKGIRTLPVRFGDAFGRLLFVCFAVAAFVAIALMSALGPLSRWSLLVFLAAPIAIHLCRMVYSRCPDDADARSAKLITAFGALMILSMMLERWA